MRNMIKLWVLLSCVVVSSVALASADEEIKVTFWGFSADARMAMAKIVDPNGGNRVAVFTIPEGKMVTSRPFATEAQAKQIKKKLSKKYHISDAGKNSTQGPRGKITFFGILKGKYFVIMAMRGNRTAVFDKISAGKAPQVQLKEVWWSADGRSMVVIINKKKSSADYGFDIDTLRFYRYYPSALKFK